MTKLFITTGEIGPGIIHIDLNFTKRVVPFTYDFNRKIVRHIVNDKLLETPLDGRWQKRFNKHMAQYEQQEKDQ